MCPYMIELCNDAQGKSISQAEYIHRLQPKAEKDEGNLPNKSCTTRRIQSSGSLCSLPDRMLVVADLVIAKFTEQSVIYLN